MRLPSSNGSAVVTRLLKHTIGKVRFQATCKVDLAAHVGSSRTHVIAPTNQGLAVQRVVQALTGAANSQRGFAQAQQLAALEDFSETPVHLTAVSSRINAFSAQRNAALSSRAKGLVDSRQRYLPAINNLIENGSSRVGNGQAGRKFEQPARHQR